MLTMDVVREHCKLDGGDQDALLKIYVDAAVSAAERYSMRRMKPGRATDSFPSPMGRSFKLSADPNGAVVARVYAGGQLQQFILQNVSRRMAILPVTLDCVDHLEFEYSIGPACPVAGAIVDTDPLIELGILKFVAHAVMAKGDDPNCWASDSGAAAIWRSFKPIGFG